MMANEAKLNLLIGLDGDLAERIGAQGVHLPERALSAGSALRLRHPDWILTGAAHGAEGLAAAKAARLDAAVLSPVFPSSSCSAGAPLGVERFSELTARAGLPVYALGGVNAATAPQLAYSGSVGLAAVEGVLEAFGPSPT
jgi:thiamine-phosphate pyrophosphorylase